jgi:plastocyanin
MVRLSRRQFTAMLGLGATLPLIAQPARAADHSVTIKNMKFDPAELTVAAGDTVTFTNADGAPHTATADDGNFDTGKLTKGQSASLIFASAGVFAYHCNIHRSMKATVTVA